MMRNIHQICPSTSFMPLLGREKARVFALNLPSRLILKAADVERALESAEFLAKKGAIKNYHGTTAAENCRETPSDKDLLMIAKPHFSIKNQLLY
jgi:hypothetical protein